MEGEQRQEDSEKPEPELLYHYTTQEGLLGILKSKKIWATNVGFLNDTREYKAGVAYIETAMKAAEELSGSHSEDDRRRIERIIEALNDCDFYVASFSSANKGDALSLWRAYGKSLPGYSLGFSRSKLREVIRPRSDGTYSGMSWLSEVSYISEGLHTDMSSTAELLKVPTVDAMMSYLRSNAARNLVTQGANLDEWVAAISNEADAVKRVGLLLTSLVPSIKDMSFSDERESRVIAVRSPRSPSNTSDPVRFHHGSWSIVPHVEIPLSFGPEKPPIVERIVVGPCPHPVEAKRAVEILLASLQIPSILVESSQIPYRNW